MNATALGSPPDLSPVDALTRYLYARPSFRATGTPSPRLDHARRLLRALGDPQDACRTVHVAGTAGKGSVTAFTAAVLTAHGFRTGAYLSPHAYTVLERFQRDGRPVAAEVAARHLADVAAAVSEIDRRGEIRPTFFEVSTALAFQLFAHDDVDYAVVETGLGGLLDATNTISRADKVAVLTTIGLDHTEVLGRTLPEIATQKAGILPRGGRAYAVHDPLAEVVEAVVAEARRRRCALELVDTEEYRRTATVGPEGTVLRLPGGQALTLGPHGRHQAGNAALALRVVEGLARRDHWQVDPDAVREGLRRVRLPGRFERRTRFGRRIVLDGAHNPVKIAALVATLQDTYPGCRFPWVLALKQDKDLDGVVDAIAPVASVDRSAPRGGTGHGAAPGRRRRFVPPARRAGRSRMDLMIHNSGAGPWARFDDLQAGCAYAFSKVDRTVVAERAEDVVPVLEEVERATDAGMWAFGFVAYEAAAGLDPRLSVHRAADDGPPLAWFGLTDEPLSVEPLPDGPASESGYTASWRRTWTPAEHRRDVGRIRQQIADGETYQCNLTVRMRGHVTGDPFAMYRDLVLGQRGAYNAYLDLGRFVVASASPELFFERTGDDLLLRPMKGTAARGRDLAEDRREALLLRSSSKERAENVMIVDLMRNDVARVAEVGGVGVRGLCRVERYETVLQMTSDVRARLRPEIGLTELFRALFPSGSVTGAPKASTMALSRDLEPTPRGVYCGAIGFVGPPGAPVRARFNVAIRTAVVDRASGEAVYGVGSGITWSSEPAAEHAEVVAKTVVLGRRHEDYALVETMRWSPERGLRNRDRHLRRLAESAEHLGFPCDLPTITKELAAGLAGHGPRRVRLRLHRDGGVAVDLSAPPPPSSGPVTLVVDDEPVDSRSPWLRHKTTLREVYERRSRRHPDADEVVMINERGELTEVTRANLALRIGGRWWTPPLSSGCLPGVERSRLLDLGKLHERVLHVADLHRAERIAVISSLRGRRPAIVRASGAGRSA